MVVLLLGLLPVRLPVLLRVPLEVEDMLLVLPKELQLVPLPVRLKEQQLVWLRVLPGVLLEAPLLVLPRVLPEVRLLEQLRVPLEVKDMLPGELRPVLPRVQQLELLKELLKEQPKEQPKEQQLGGPLEVKDMLPVPLLVLLPELLLALRLVPLKGQQPGPKTAAAVSLLDLLLMKIALVDMLAGMKTAVVLAEITMMYLVYLTMDMPGHRAILLNQRPSQIANTCQYTTAL